MVEMTEVAIATTLEYVSLSANSRVGYTAFKASITGCVRFLNSTAVKLFKSSATMSPLENGPTIWKGGQSHTLPYREDLGLTRPLTINACCPGRIPISRATRPEERT